MNKVTKAGVAGLTALVLAGGATAAFANTGSSPDPAKDGKVDVTREHKGVRARSTTPRRIGRPTAAGRTPTRSRGTRRTAPRTTRRTVRRTAPRDPSNDLSLR